MSYVRRTGVAVGAVLLVAFMAWLLMGYVVAFTSSTEITNHSPAYAGIGVKSTLENGDTLNCVVKTSPGWFRALSRTFNNGNVTDLVRADKWGEVNCHYTGVNNGAHQAGSDPASDGGPLNWADKSDHGT